MQSVDPNAPVQGLTPPPPPPPPPPGNSDVEALHIEQLVVNVPPNQPFGGALQPNHHNYQLKSQQVPFASYSPNMQLPQYGRPMLNGPYAPLPQYGFAGAAAPGVNGGAINSDGQAPPAYVPMMLPQVVTGVPIQYHAMQGIGGVGGGGGGALPDQAPPINPMAPDPNFVQRVALEAEIRRTARYFTGCNICWGILLVLSAASYAIGLSQTTTGETNGEPINDQIYAANKIFIAEYCVWLCGIVVGVVGVCRFQPVCLKAYSFALVLAAILQIIGSIVEFKGFARWSGGAKIVAVILLILILLVQYFFFKKS